MPTPEELARKWLAELTADMLPSVIAAIESGRFGEIHGKMKIVGGQRQKIVVHDEFERVYPVDKKPCGN